MFASSAEASLENLNDAQRRAATHMGGPLLILAGAGTGKTTTLCARVAWLVDQVVSPERILLLTFTRRAAREMLVIFAASGRQCAREYQIASRLAWSA